jgi:acetyl-CoA synthetase
MRRIEFDELPTTISGKIRRVEVRQREDEAHRSGTSIGTEHRYEDLVT